MCHNLKAMLLVFVFLFVVTPGDCLTQLPILYDSSNNLHRDIQYHPEQPARIETCVQALQEYKQNGESRIDLVDVADTCNSGNTHRPFSNDELDHARSMLVQAHSEGMVSALERQCRESRQQRISDGKNPLGFVGYIDYDTYVTTESYDVCLRATAAWIRAVDLALDGGAAMALTRPPGHHATSELSNGFCLFNFAAAAALHALQRDAKVSILDWDVHYGQGVADIVMKEPRVRYVSIHQTPAFPYMGEMRSQLGEYKNVLTVPVLADTTWTCGYQHYFNDIALPFVQSPEWEPDLVIVCAGYDGLLSDELASMSLTAQDYGTMTRRLLEHLQLNRDKRPGIVLGLEGGYQLANGAAGGNLADAVLVTVQALLDEAR